MSAAPALAQGTGAPAPTDPPPLRVGPVTVAGYIQADAQKIFGDRVEEAPDTFRVRRARFALSGDIAPKIGWSLSVDLAGGSAVSMRDAHITIRFNPQLNVRVGQFYPIYGLERLTSTSRLEVIDRTRMTDRITYERNPGIALLNLRPWKRWVTYAIGAWNGPGQNQPDNNDAKDVVGRLVISPPMLGGLAFGVNGARGDQPDGTRTRVGLDVLLDRPSFKIAVEGLRERYRVVPERRGFYVLGAYRYYPRTPTPHFRGLELAARFAAFRDPTFGRQPTPTASFIPPTTDEIQFGANYYVNRNVRFQGNAIVPVDDRDAPRATLIGRLQVIF